MKKYFGLISMVVFILVSTNNQVVAQNYTAQQMYEKANQCFDNNDLTNAEKWLEKSSNIGYGIAREDLLQYQLLGTTSYYKPSQQQQNKNTFNAINNLGESLYQEEVENLKKDAEYLQKSGTKKECFSRAEIEYSFFVKSNEKRDKNLHLLYALKYYRFSAQKGYKKAQKKLKELGY